MTITRPAQDAPRQMSLLRATVSVLFPFATGYYFPT